ncbi:PCP reductase family protein [Acidihalobacter prosperus]|uniref:Protochlorophyllide oxidoreductase n=1 Tax=Acidihalobacter prosperus TaxID=160660 RepID=A0A1A6C4E7_9GAMM|nr:PCP reductase family protein [Acidihalobacter prosperus]OBS09436.1 protochlorophyllide oxidoreductase [Acidihalobacter prosperus]
MNDASLPWDDDARQRLEKMPAFVRPMAQAKIEKAAREAGESRVTAAFIESQKSRLMG